MASGPHYTQAGGVPAVTGAGFGMLACDCGQSLLIAGYEARHFLDIAIKCAACGRITETPRLPEGALPPTAVTVLERGADNPPRIDAETFLISREEAARLAARYQPRPTDADTHVISDALLDDVDYQQWRFTGAYLDPAPDTYRSQPLAWAVAHLRQRLRDPNWTTVSDANDLAAMTAVAAFRDLFASWAHHPLFAAMVATVAAEQFSPHAIATFGVAKSLMLAGNQVTFVAGQERPTVIVSLRLVRGQDDAMPVAVSRFDRFESSGGAPATPQEIRAAVMEAVGSVQGSINRLHPGILVLTCGACDPTFERVVYESIVEAVGSLGKRNRGLAAAAPIFAKVGPTGRPREARFGYAFYPVPNRNHSIGQSVRIGSRADYSAIPSPPPSWGRRGSG